MRIFYQNFRRLFSSSLLLLTGFCLSAQVTVGDEVAPQNFSILEISTQNVKGGLRLPHLTTVQRNGLNMALNSAAPGLLIYNIDTNCMEYWNGSKWISQCFDMNFNSIPDGTGIFTGKTVFDIAYSNGGAEGCGPVSDRTRIKTEFSNRTSQDPGLPGYVAPYTGVQVYTFKPSQAVSKVRFVYRDITGKVIEKITPNIDYSEMTNISTDCKVTVDFNEYLDRELRGLTFQNALGAQLYVLYNDNALGTGTERKLQLNLILTDCACGAATTTGWLNFMCHNLGADETLNPFSYIEGKADGAGGTLGWLYQWGRPTDGHQKRNSSTTTTLADNNEATLPVEVKGKFIIVNTGDPFDWRSGGGNNARWGNGTAATNPPKATNDPCPTGWKVPSYAQLQSIFTNVTSPNVWTWTGNGYKVGDALYLPAAGDRSFLSSATIDGIGTTGNYWNSTVVLPSSSRKVRFTSTLVSLGFDTRAYGNSVRCVEE